MSENGPKSLRDISVGEKILGYDFQKGKQTYTPVIAWMHRDTDVQAEYNIIKSKTGEEYKASAGHNIAYNE